jgi:hypothetical protein
MEARAVSQAITMVRKRRVPSQNPGPWAGSGIHVDNGVITVTVTQEHWDKAVNIITWIHNSMKDSNELVFNIVESYRGFLVYFSRTYHDLTI